ncbi:MAG: hypothetical protein AUK35_06830 [Zetaproteobacteria bacterium CG2_30_46_52]|nr:MAG: hypothetical protein AUK35_06830 [Zetaproteobacteria bacterium CG2_30_46_52]
MEAYILRIPAFMRTFTFFIVMIFTYQAYAAPSSLDRDLLLQSFDGADKLQLAETLPNENNNLGLAMQQSKPVRTLIDVRSNHSDGTHDFAALISLAQQRHIQALAFTEHDRYSIRFGLEPMPHIFGYSLEHPSLYQSGLETFFADLNHAQQSSGITLFAGTESTPGYTWHGIPFKDLSLRDAEQHIITLGAKAPEDIQALTSYQLKHGHGHQSLSMVFWFVLIFILVRVLLRKRKRSIAFLLVGSFIAFLSTWMLKPQPNQVDDFIQSAHEQNMMTIWAHPGTLSGVREGPAGILLDTPPYNTKVFSAPTADGFAALYGDTDNNTEAGGAWDKYMLNYMRGYLAKPIWAVAAGDYHEEGQSGEYLGNYPMDVWADSNDAPSILSALKLGRMASWHMQPHQHLSVQKLFLTYSPKDKQSPPYLMPGDEAVVGRLVTVGISITDLAPDAQAIAFQGAWIVDGKVVEKPKILSNGQVFTHNLTLSEGVHVIRFELPAQQGLRMVANPFLVRVRK